MALISPMLRMQQQAEASLMPYGPPLSPPLPAPAEPGIQLHLVETFGEIELEYAALRKGVALLDQPHRATIECVGTDAIDFLNNMVTQELKKEPALTPYQSRRAFWLNRKGRIDADLRILRLPDASSGHPGQRLLLDVDAHALARTLSTLGGYVITEDVTLTDATAHWHRLALHGPTGPALLAALTTPIAGSPIASLAPGHAAELELDGHRLLAFRDDTAGEIGLELFIPTASVLAVYQRFIESAAEHENHAPESPNPSLRSRIRLRPIGWHAFNIARIEAGTPLYNVDFGSDSLPAESGVLLDRVSFTKGCYLGQEIVARMHARGHPKQQLVALRPLTPASAPALSPEDLAAAAMHQPVSGAHLFRPETDNPTNPTNPTNPRPKGDPVGAVTSSTISPMLGSQVIALAQLKYELCQPNTQLLAQTPAGLIRMTVQPALTAWSSVAQASRL